MPLAVTPTQACYVHSAAVPMVEALQNVVRHTVLCLSGQGDLCMCERVDHCTSSVLSYH